MTARSRRGGLFRALAERGDPIYLDEVIRHRHEAEREGAKLIREGEGAEAIDLYRSEERVVVAADAELRREAMVADWHESFARGEDAVMVAKRNVEVERLNAMARHARREAGELGTGEILTRRAELGDEVHRERKALDAHIQEGPHVRISEGQHRVAVERREAVEAGGWRQRRRELAGALEREASCRDALARNIARAERNGPLTDTATREDAVAGQVLAERRELAVIAARLAPPAYITKELGERPTDSEKRRSWEAGVRTIEGFRQERGVKDRDHAFGQGTSRSAERAREQAQQRLRQSQRELGRLKEAARTRDMDFSLGIGR